MRICAPSGQGSVSKHLHVLNSQHSAHGGQAFRDMWSRVQAGEESYSLY